MPIKIFQISFVFLCFTMSGYAQILEWNEQIQGNTDDAVTNIMVDDSGNYIVAGYYGKNTDLDPGAGQIIKTCWFLPGIYEYYDAFIAKYDTAFNVKFLNTFGGVRADGFSEIAFDSKQNIVATAFFQDSADMDPGPGKNMIYSVHWLDYLIYKCDPNGNIMWYFNLGSRGYNQGASLTIDIDDNIYILGTFQDSIDLDPGIGKAMAYSVMRTDVFLVKYNANGKYLWHRNFGGLLFDTDASISYSDSNYLYICGSYMDTVDFDPGPGRFTMQSSHQQDIYFSKFDTSGKFIWAKSLGGNDNEQPFRLELDENDNIYITGIFKSNIDLDPGSATAFHTVKGDADIFVAKYDFRGKYVWSKTFGGTGYDQGRDIELMDTSFVFISGTFESSMDANPGNGVNNIYSTGTNDAFLTQLKSNGDYVRTIKLGGSSLGDFLYDMNHYKGNQLLVGGSYSDSTDVDPSNKVKKIGTLGKIDGLMIEYNMCVPDFITDSLTICHGNIYTFPDGDTSSQAIVDTSTFENVFGCDSVIITHLQIDSFYLIYKSVGICYGEVYFFPDSSYSSQSTIDTSAFLSAKGCDSLFITDLSVFYVDTGITLLGNNEILANAQNATFQWLDCNNLLQPISGETNPSITPQQNGSYAVGVTQNSCKDTSSCIVMKFVGINKIDHNKILFYPNPFDGIIFIQLSQKDDFSVAIYNLLGDLIFSESFANQFEAKIKVPDTMESGMYILKIDSKAETITEKIILDR